MAPESPPDSSAGKDEAADVTKDAVDEQTNGGDVVVDVPEKMCRICHLSYFGYSSRPVDLIALGCRCKNDLGTAHRGCAQRWFHTKGSRCCEICGQVARNVTGIRDHGPRLEWNDMIRTSHVYMTVERRYRTFCIFVVVMLCLILALHWIFY